MSSPTLPPSKDVSRPAGCGDNSCIHGRPGGMGTNGGCSCKKVPPDEKVALEYFTAYFEQNYNGTVVFHDPRWHAPKVFRAAMWALQQAAKDAGDPVVEAIHKARENREIVRLQREVDYCVINHDAELTKYRTALEEICTRRRCPIAEKALGLSDAPCGCPRDSFGHVKCEERSGPEHTYCVAERNAENSHEG